MSYTIKQYNSLSGFRQKAEIEALVDMCSTEFVPPLHTRTSTEQQVFGDSPADTVSYFELMLDQPVLVAYEVATCQIAGFMAYLPGYVHNYLKGYSPSCYVSTIIVKKQHRRKGVARLLYDGIINQCEWNAISTRTWSENYSHIGLLSELGFEEIKRIIDHRGKGLDTLYFGMKTG